MRDIVQNHLLQVLSFVAMEPPGSFDVESVRNERAKVLATLRSLGTADVVRGQYDAGFIGGDAGARLPRRAGRRPELADRDLRRRAAGGRQLALGRGAVLRAHRQAPRQARQRGRDPVQARAAPAVLVRGGRAARAQRARAAHPAQRGHRAALRRQGAEHAHADPHRQHGLRLRHGLRDRAGRGLRDAARRRPARRCHQLHPHRRRDGRLARRGSGPARLAERGRRSAPVRRRAAGGPRRPTTCWRATDAGGGGRERDRAPSRSASPSCAAASGARRARSCSTSSCWPTTRARPSAWPACSSSCPATARRGRSSRWPRTAARALDATRRGRDDAARRAATASCAASSCTSPPATRARRCRA